MPSVILALVVALVDLHQNDHLAVWTLVILALVVAFGGSDSILPSTDLPLLQTENRR